MISNDKNEGLGYGIRQGFARRMAETMFPNEKIVICRWLWRRPRGSNIIWC